TSPATAARMDARPPRRRSSRTAAARRERCRSPLDEPSQQRPVTALRLDASRRAQKRDRLALLRPASELVNRRRLRPHLDQVAAAKLAPRDGLSPLAVVVGVERRARTQVRKPCVPRFVCFAHAPWPVPANEEPKAV